MAQESTASEMEIAHFYFAEWNTGNYLSSVTESITVLPKAVPLQEPQILAEQKTPGNGQRQGDENGCSICCTPQSWGGRDSEAMDGTGCSIGCPPQDWVDQGALGDPVAQPGLVLLCAHLVKCHRSGRTQSRRSVVTVRASPS